MNAFKDNKGHAWKLEINLPAAKRLKALAGFDINEVVTGDGKLMGRLANDPMFLAECLWAICETEAATAAISEAQFMDSITGPETIDAALTAILETIINFFPSHLRNPLRKAVARMTEAMTAASKEAIEMIEQIQTCASSASSSN